MFWLFLGHASSSPDGADQYSGRYCGRLARLLIEMSQTPQREETCRICLESSPVSGFPKLSDSFFPEEDRLISPCACSGTQAYVHFKCLRRWQRAVVSTRRPSAGHGPALVCSVCTQKFSVAPPRPGLGFQVWRALTGYSCEVTGLLIILCACYVALAGHSLQTLLDELEGGLALAREVLPCSFRLHAVEENYSSQNQNTLPRGRLWGSHNSMNRLHPGTLLIATPAMQSPSFFGSVVLLYEHQRCSGSRGLVLNKQSSEKTKLEWEKKLFFGRQGTALIKQIEHGMGGPVAQRHWMVLHRCADCMDLKKNGSEKHELLRDWGQELLPGIYVGRDIGPVIRNLDVCNQSGMVQYGVLGSMQGVDCFNRMDADEEKSKQGGGRGSSKRKVAAEDAKREQLGFHLKHHILHGHAEWYVGQLGSEIRRGMWVIAENTSDILHSTSLHELWHTLLGI